MKCLKGRGRRGSWLALFWASSLAVLCPAAKLAAHPAWFPGAPLPGWQGLLFLANPKRPAGSGALQPAQGKRSPWEEGARVSSEGIKARPHRRQGSHGWDRADAGAGGPGAPAGRSRSRARATGSRRGAQRGSLGILGLAGHVPRRDLQHRLQRQGNCPPARVLLRGLGPAPALPRGLPAGIARPGQIACLPRWRLSLPPQMWAERAACPSKRLGVGERRGGEPGRQSRAQLFRPPRLLPRWSRTRAR